MAKHKQTKRERKFNAKGGVQKKLQKGHKFLSKGRLKQRKKDDKPSRSGKKKNDSEQSFTQQQEAQRESENFVGKNNLGDMDISSFLANLEEDLKKNDSDGEESAEIIEHYDSEEGMEDSDSEEEVTTSKKSKKKKDDSDSDEDEDDEESSSEDEETTKKAAAKKTSKKSKKQQDSSDSDDSDSDSEDSSSEEEEKPTKKKAKVSKKKAAKDSSDSESSNSDDEDIEAVEAKMKAEMKKMKSQDPEFHEYLKENEQSLLEFGEEDDDSDDDDSDEEDEKPTKNRKKDDDDEEEGNGNTIELTPRILRDMERGAFQAHGIKSLKKLIRAYKSACQVAANAGDKEETTQGRQFRIEDASVFDTLMVSCLGQCHEAFYFHLLASDEEKEATTSKKAKKEKESQGKKSKKNKNKSKGKEQEKEPEPEPEEENKDDKPLDPKLLERSPKWMEVKPAISAFMKATQQLITESKEPDLLAIVLKAMSNYMRYLSAFPNIAESVLKTLVSLWSAPLGDASAEYQVVRLNAFLRIRQLALTQPFPFIELCLKKSYLAYARRAKYGGAGSIMTNALPTLTFMGNCLVELYSLDHASSYQHAFVYIRQLALYLRAVMQKKTPEAFQQVYGWQYMHCLKLWVSVLSGAIKQAREGTDNHDESLMRSLVYPLTEIIMGTVRLAPAPARHVPLRFHCVRLLQQLAASAEMFIPTTTLLLEVLDLKQLNMRPKKIKGKGGGATTRGVQLPFLIKLAKDDPLRTAEEQEACVAEVFKLLNREADLYRYSAGFPEFAMLITQRLRKYNKNTKNSRWRAYARGCIDLCKRHTDAAINARSNLAEAPKDVKKLECLRQPNEPSMAERYDAAVEKENKEWTSLIDAPETTAAKKKRSSDEDDSASEEEEEAEEGPKKAAKSKKRNQAPAPPELDDEVMEIEDTVKEGVEWSDDEE